MDQEDVNGKGIRNRLIPKELVDFKPNPNNAFLLFGNDDWLVWVTQKIVIGTERYRASTFTYYYYLQAEPKAPAQLIYNMKSSHGDGVAGVLKDGTVVMEWRAMTAGIRLVKKDGTTKEFIIDKLLSEKDYSAISLAVSDDGILMQAYQLNEDEPVYFIPWSKGKTELEIKKKIMVTDKNGIPVSDKKVFWDKNLIISWNTPRLFIYDLSMEKLNIFEIQKYREDWWFPEIVAFDGETVIIRNEANKIRFDIVSKKQSLIPIPGDVVTVNNKIVYVVKKKEKSYKKGSYSYQLVAYDLDSDQDKGQILFELGYDWQPEGKTIVRKSGLWIWKGKKWEKFEWLK